MRNLKKALSLVLAMVMLLGMMIVGAGAASFKDNEQVSTEYKTAAAVLEKIGVMEGTDGYFNPKTNLNRVEGAAIIYRLVTGGLSMNPSGESGFVDVDGVDSFSWASGTVAACRDLGIVSGVDATHFAPGEPLTVAAFSKMLLVTLGYEDKYAGYNGEKWETAVARARGILLDGLAMNAQLTREQAAQMAFKALVAETVEYSIPVAATSSSDALLAIMDEDGTPLYIEKFDITGTEVAGTGHLFWVQVQGNTTGNTVASNTPYTNETTNMNTMPTTGLIDGTYRYKVEFSEAGDWSDTLIIGSGSFVIVND